MNALIEKSSKKYAQRMSEWIDIALEEGIRFFVTSLGKPGAARPGVTAGTVIHANQSVGTIVNTDFCPFQLGDIVINQSADGVYPLRYPVRLA